MCTYNGKEVLRSSVTCEKKNGCREIETHGECCPKFLCGKIKHFKLVAVNGWAYNIIIAIDPFCTRQFYDIR